MKHNEKITQTAGDQKRKNGNVKVYFEIVWKESLKLISLNIKQMVTFYSIWKFIPARFQKMIRFQDDSSYLHIIMACWTTLAYITHRHYF